VNAPAMAFETTAADYDEARSRTGWTMTVSVLVHAVLMLLVILVKPVVDSTPVISEITLIDPSDLAPAAPEGGAPAQAAATSPGLRIASAIEERFRRMTSKADDVPVPQTETAADRLSARLASLRQDTSLPVASGAVSGAPSALLSTPAGVPGGSGVGGKSLSLDRGGSGGGSGPPLALGRGGPSGTSRALAAASGPAIGTEAPATAPEGDAHARRTLAGAQLAGPIADRAIRQYVTPVYPEWAKRDGVEAAVTLYFIVRADGSVKENILIQKTAGFGDFDESARAALAAWKFEPLGGGRTGEQWGTVTFHFRLRDN
jgi:TonB family protein